MSSVSRSLFPAKRETARSKSGGRARWPICNELAPEVAEIHDRAHDTLSGSLRPWEAWLFLCIHDAQILSETSAAPFAARRWRNRESRYRRPAATGRLFQLQDTGDSLRRHSVGPLRRVENSRSR